MGPKVAGVYAKGAPKEAVVSLGKYHLGMGEQPTDGRQCNSNKARIYLPSVVMTAFVEASAVGNQA